MHHPRTGERVHVRPSNPSVPVQRGDGLFGQFLPPQGQECLWDDFLHRRWCEGSVTWSPLTPAPTPSEGAESSTKEPV